ncbi:undecaprenyldiphospho-muramoylpentapeptide beta-N-acetylglucosaminyltransferase [Thermovibrio sp.]
MRVVIAGGGTGGHYFPALAVAEELRKRGHELLFVGSKGGIEGRLGFPADRSLLFDYTSFRGKGVRGVSALLGYGRAAVELLGILKEFKPDCAVIFGGYSSLPLGVACALKGVPLFIQEQNSVPGKTNRFLSRFAVKAFLGFPQAERYLRCECLFTGNPLRREVLEAAERRDELRRRVLAELSLEEGRKTLLILGGSQGALSINRLVEKAAPGLKGKPLQVIHLTGYGKEGRLREVYAGSRIPAAVIPFYGKIWELYAASDGVVSRAGALAVSEIAAFRLPSILIPYPYAADEHQYFNGKFLADRGGALLFRESELSVELFLQGIERILFDIMERRKMEEALSGLFPPDGTSLIVREIEEWRKRRS